MLKARISKYIYHFLIWITLPFACFRIWLKCKNEVYNNYRFKDRFGFFSNITEPCIWVHAVSFGEVQAAAPLVNVLLQRTKNISIVITTVTGTGADHVQRLWQGKVKHCYAPFDLPIILKRFFVRLNPVIIILMETELWPFMIAEASHCKVPVILANARLSAKSARGYQRFLPLTSHMLSQITHVAAQAEDDGKRFLALGLDKDKLSIMGSLKFDIEVSESEFQQAKIIKQQLGLNRLIWIAASTHDGEERIILNVFKELQRKIPQIMLLLVPRHPERFTAVARLIASYEINYTCFSTIKKESTPVSKDIDILLGDTMGDLCKLYGVADIAFIGGSLVARGGHNMLEALVMRTPVIVGPYMYNFETITKMLVSNRAVVQVKNEEELSTSILQILNNKKQREKYIYIGFQMVEQHRGALKRLLSIISDNYTELGQ